MPGIVGYTVSRADESNPKLLSNMLESMKHKDWQRTQTLLTPILNAGRVHLGIFNTEQPVFSKNKKLSCLMDGKIYDYESEIQRLESLGHEFPVANDPEYCLHAYEQEGLDFVNRLDGSFNLVIGDENRKEILVVNDRLGQRPLYWAEDADQLFFASEVKALLCNKRFQREIDPGALAEYLVFGGMLGDKTFFREVKLLPPASILKWQKGRISLGAYWELKHRQTENGKDGLLVKELTGILRRTTSKWYSYPFRYGFGLSGGLDSRLLLSATEEGMRAGFRAFTFGEQDCDEIRIARVVASRLGTPHTTITWSPDDLVDHIEEVAVITDGMGTAESAFMPYAYERIRRFADAVSIDFMLDTLLQGNLLYRSTFNVKSDVELGHSLYTQLRRYSDEELSTLLTAEYFGKARGKALSSIMKTVSQIEAAKFTDKSDAFHMIHRLRRMAMMGLVIMRNYVEEVCPTASNEFTQALLKIPDGLRRNRRLYVKVLRELSPETMIIPHQATMLPPSAPFLFQRVSYRIQRLLERLRETIWRVTNRHVLMRDWYGFVHIREYIWTSEKWREYIRKTLLTEEAEIYKRRIFQMEGVKRLVLQLDMSKESRAAFRKVCQLLVLEVFLKKMRSSA